MTQCNVTHKNVKHALASVFSLSFSNEKQDLYGYLCSEILAVFFAIISMRIPGNPRVVAFFDTFPGMIVRNSLGTVRNSSWKRGTSPAFFAARNYLDSGETASCCY